MSFILAAWVLYTLSAPWWAWVLFALGALLRVYVDNQLWKTHRRVNALWRDAQWPKSLSLRRHDGGK